MLLRLFILFLIVPILELLIFLEIGKQIGGIATIAIIIITALVGAILAKREGIQVIKQIKKNISMGIIPAPELLHGLLVLIAGLLLLTPGLLTDLVGFLLLISQIRNKIIKIFLRRLGKKWKAIKFGNVYKE